MEEPKPLSPIQQVLLRGINALATKDAKKLRRAVEAGLAIGWHPKPGWEVVLLEWEASGVDGPLDPDGRTANLKDLPWEVG